MPEVAEARQDKLAKPTTFPAMLDRYKGEIARALPHHMSADRMARIALTEFRKNPKLGECDPRSVFAAIIQASQLGLEPGNVLGHAYLVPFKNECQLIPGYRGLVELARRSGLVQRIEAHAVRQGEKFTYKTGLTTVLEHEPQLEGARGPLRLAYAVAEFKEGGYHAEVMVEEDINRIRDRSQGYQYAKKYNRDTPWETDTEEMWRKTLLRRICKQLPMSPEMATAFQLEEAAAQGRQALTVQDAIDGTWQAPVLEVTTQDNNLAAKSNANLDEIKRKYAEGQEPPPPSPERIAALRAEAERQQKMLDEKYGASQPSSMPPENVTAPEASTAAATAEPSAAPPNQQPVEVGPPPQDAVEPEGVPGEEATPSVSPDPEQHGVPVLFDEPPKGKAKRTR